MTINRGQPSVVGAGTVEQRSGSFGRLVLSGGANGGIADRIGSGSAYRDDARVPAMRTQCSRGYGEGGGWRRGVKLERRAGRVRRAGVASIIRTVAESGCCRRIRSGVVGGRASVDTRGRIVPGENYVNRMVKPAVMVRRAVRRASHIRWWSAVKLEVQGSVTRVTSVVLAGGGYRGRHAIRSRICRRSSAIGDT